MNPRRLSSSGRLVWSIHATTALLKTLKLILLSLGERVLKSQLQVWESHAVAKGAALGAGQRAWSHVISVVVMRTTMDLNRSRE